MVGRVAGDQAGELIAAGASVMYTAAGGAALASRAVEGLSCAQDVWAVVNSFTDQNGNVTKLTYSNRPLDSTDAGTHWSLLLNKTAPLGVAAGSGYQWQFGYDSFGDLITLTDPLGHTTTYCYNLAAAPACNPANDPSSPGTLATETDFNGNTTTYANYDANGRAQKVTDPLGRVSAFGFDADGNLVWIQDPPHAGRDRYRHPQLPHLPGLQQLQPARPDQPAQIHHARSRPTRVDRHQLRPERRHDRRPRRPLRAAGRR